MQLLPLILSCQPIGLETGCYARARAYACHAQTEFAGKGIEHQIASTLYTCTRSTRATLRDEHGRKPRKEPDAGLCASCMLHPLWEYASPPVVEAGATHENHHTFLLEAVAWLRSANTQVPDIPSHSTRNAKSVDHSA